MVNLHKKLKLSYLNSNVNKILTLNFRIHYLAFFSLILLFTACGEGGSGNINSISETASSYDVPMSCEQAPLSVQKSNADTMPIGINNPNNNPKILLQPLKNNTISLSTETLTFDKASLYNLFKTKYYWASETPSNVDYLAYTTPQSLIDDLKNEKDRWSFAMTKEDYANLTSQRSGGFGFACEDVTDGCHVTYVRIDSPADRVGLKRGDIIASINDKNATHNLIYTTGETLDVLNSFNIKRDSSNQVCSCKITPREYTYKVAQSKIVNTNNHQKVGYFRLDSFLGEESIIQEINEAFNGFKKADISKLVIDLRYNGGGSVDIASTLLDRLTNTHNQDPQFTLTWNDDYQKNNEAYAFKTEDNSLNLDQILFLTTQDTASASELVISAMKPYMAENKLVIIGDHTHGKPVGMREESDKNYYYFLINFVVKNSIGFYDYFNGFPVTTGCNIEDDPYHEMGDTHELMLKAALNYIDTGSCQ